jgi:uncharacterized protein YdiU (UPF0061 family)
VQKPNKLNKNRAISCAGASVRSLLKDDSAAFNECTTQWRQRLAEGGHDAEHRQAVMHGANPALIPRNHLVEEAIVLRNVLLRCSLSPPELSVSAVSGNLRIGRNYPIEG